MSSGRDVVRGGYFIVGRGDRRRERGGKRGCLNVGGGWISDMIVSSIVAEFRERARDKGRM